MLNYQWMEEQFKKNNIKILSVLCTTMSSHEINFHELNTEKMRLNTI